MTVDLLFHRLSSVLCGKTDKVYFRYSLKIRVCGPVVDLSGISPGQEVVMQKTPAMRLVRVGSARRETRADSETGFMEQIQIYLWEGQLSIRR